MNELAFAGLPEVVDEGILAVLLGSGVAIVALGGRRHAAVAVRTARAAARPHGVGGAFAH